MDEQTKVLIFGGSGFIGSHLVHVLHGAYPGLQIFNADIVSCNHHGESQFIYCDVRLPIVLEGIDFGADAIVFNLAAIHRTPGHKDEEYFGTNLRGAQNVCDFASQKGVRTIVFTSSIAPYGASEELKTEQTLPLSNTPYGISKLVAEKMHEIWKMGDTARNLLILRPGAVFGKGERGNFTRLYQGLQKRRFLYPGRKDTIKGAIYVKDLVAFMLHELTSMRGGYCETYNCTYHPAYTIEQIVNTICSVTAVPKPWGMVPGGLLKSAAFVIGALGGKSLGIHPDRVKKLMISTNISGAKLAATSFVMPYGLEGGINDWFADNDNRCLE